MFKDNCICKKSGTSFQLILYYINYISYFSVDVSTKKIILMSDFNEEADIISQFQADAIADRLSTENIKLITM